jgi:Ankyrin repeats (many copies)
METGLLRPMHLAPKTGNVGAIRLLADLGANVNVKEGRKGYNPIHFAATGQDVQAIKLAELGANEWEEQQWNQSHTCSCGKTQWGR